MSSSNSDVPAVDNLDTQAYLEIDENNDSLASLTSETVEDVESQEAGYEDAGVTDEDDDEEEGTYYVDSMGNYIFQPSSSAAPKDPIIVSSESPGELEELEEMAPEQLEAIATEELKEISPEDVLQIRKSPRKSGRNLNAARVQENEDDQKAEGNEEGDPSVEAPVLNRSTERPFKCNLCERAFKSDAWLQNHIATHNGRKRHALQCSMCEREFKTNLGLRNHVNAHLGNKPHDCKFCDSVFTTYGELVRHVRYRHTSEKPHKCTECDYSTVEMSKLRRHMRIHTGERPYQCPDCSYASRDSTKLKRHMRTHTGEKPYACDLCPARFSQSNSVKAHRLIHTDGDKPVFQCTLCPTTCVTKNTLQVHVQNIHHTKKNITCRRCDKDFGDRYSYKQHIKTHQGEKCHRCHLCPYASASKPHLESHMLIHTDMKPFVCEYCKLSFRHKQLLKRHINLYHVADYKPPQPRAKILSCPDCKRSFAHKANLLRHMAEHDPKSNAKSEKLKLKMGRLTRVKADGSVVNVATNKLRRRPAENDEIRGKEEFEDEDDDDEFLSEEDYEVITVHNGNEKRAPRKENQQINASAAAEVEDVEHDLKAIKQEIEEEEVEQKPLIPSVEQTIAITKTKERQSHLLAPQLKTVSIKKEPDGTEFMAMEVNYDREFKVEEADKNESYAAIDNTQMPPAVPFTSKTKLESCYGFVVEYVDEPDTKETIELLNSIAEN